MLNLPQKTISKIRDYLVRQQKEVDEQIVSLESDDPVLAENILEAPESGTESWQADVHARLVSVKNDMQGLSSRIRSALARLKSGTYGKCERCSKQIEVARLEVMPTATLCLECSKKPLISSRRKK